MPKKIFWKINQYRFKIQFSIVKRFLKTCQEKHVNPYYMCEYISPTVCFEPIDNFFLHFGKLGYDCVGVFPLKICHFKLTFTSQ